MSVRFHWVVGLAGPDEAPALLKRFREVEATERMPQASRDVLAAWRANPLHVDDSEAFNRCFHLPLEPFVHAVLFHGAVPGWPAGEQDLFLVTADRVPPTASLAWALGPTRLAALPGQCLQFFVETEDVGRFHECVRALFDPAHELVERACSWLSLHNWLSFDDGSFDGAEAARRLIAVLPAAAERAASERRALFSACAVAP